jgi:hypothetical protein
MSNAYAIAAVTTTLQFLLQKMSADADLSDLSVTTLPLDKARGTNTNMQLNLFLYMLSRNAAWVNAPMPRQVMPLEGFNPPLPLNLYYLLTAFGRDDDSTQPFGHLLLGKAMSLLHDYPLISAADIVSATQGSLPLNDLAQQVERLRITYHPLPLNELAMLWTGFSMQYRLSAGYEVAVTLIESTRSPTTPLPVLTRGQGDSGIPAQPNLTPPLPTLQSILIADQQPSARLGDTIRIAGVNLNGAAIGVQFSHPLLSAPIELAPNANNTATLIAVTIPSNHPDQWPAGFYNVAVALQRTGETFRRTTNSLALSLAPRIAVTPASAPAGNINYTVTVEPQVWPTQRASLSVGAQEFLADPHPTKTGTLSVSTTGLVAGSYPVRLRVDGVDSLLVDRSKTPPVYDNTQVVKVI